MMCKTVFCNAKMTPKCTRTSDLAAGSTKRPGEFAGPLAFTSSRLAWPSLSWQQVEGCASCDVFPSFSCACLPGCPSPSPVRVEKSCNYQGMGRPTEVEATGRGRYSKGPRSYRERRANRRAANCRAPCSNVLRRTRISPSEHPNSIWPPVGDLRWIAHAVWLIAQIVQRFPMVVAIRSPSRIRS